jgi:uncharacterized membrane protein
MASEWANLLLRWFHVFAGILWIGQTWLFMWMERRFQDLEENPDGHVFMVHSGGFYVVEKRPGLASLPRTLHWFKWEAALTWASGLALLVVVYYLGGLMYGGDEAIDERAAMGLGLLLLPAAWLVYDQVWCRLAARSAALGGALALALIVALAWALGLVFPARAAYIHVGAALGTIMTANVWMRILPAQRAMVGAIGAGRSPDLTLGERAKERSKHNTFIVVPLVLIMLSNHFPTATYAHERAWAVLGGLTVLGWAAAWLVRRR